MAPFKEHVAWIFVPDRAGLKCGRCDMPDDTLSQTVLRGMSLMIQTIKREEKIPNNKYVLLKAQTQAPTLKENNVMLKNWVDTDSLLKSSIIHNTL